MTDRKAVPIDDEDISILLVALDAQLERIDVDSDTDEDINLNPAAYDPDKIKALQKRLESLQDS